MADLGLRQKTRIRLPEFMDLCHGPSYLPRFRVDRLPNMFTCAVPFRALPPPDSDAGPSNHDFQNIVTLFKRKHAPTDTIPEALPPTGLITMPEALGLPIRPPLQALAGPDPVGISFDKVANEKTVNEKTVNDKDIKGKDIKGRDIKGKDIKGKDIKGRNATGADDKAVKDKAKKEKKAKGGKK
ncbi:hypothetical protein GNI_115180 [Gregarina niphandrodes]|uniref:Uncharacterized protein n=1 Tax=Gregarina niphandrodes TaxID=110365 RepID=A0A023B331_GRENI|nr:hypothetical protein GNI_115180 [Gregarina niphandrodes]EZG55289.1 hypothetical protein GNI_115180 [Gregarina niphandrodes]|eukprot:XP_011131668.1 hypothetical protein GNI_115180 [Gregarina niphandrodes]